MKKMVTLSERFQKVNLVDKIKRYFAFTGEEVRLLTVAILILGFIIGFDDGSQTFNSILWMKNLFSSILIVALAFLVQQSTQRVIGLIVGYQVRFQIWWIGLMIGLVIALISKGRLWVLLPGGIFCTVIEAHRMGKFRYGMNYWNLGWISFCGPLANILLAMFFKILLLIPFFTDNTLIQTVIAVNVWFAIFTMLPLPSLSGVNMFFASRLGYIYTYGSIIGAGILILLTPLNPFWTLLGAAAIGGVIWLLFLVFIEQGNW